MLGHMGIRPIIANSTPINNKIRIQIMANNELQLYTTYDMRYTKRLDTICLFLQTNKYLLMHTGIFAYFSNVKTKIRFRICGSV